MILTPDRIHLINLLNVLDSHYADKGSAMRLVVDTNQAGLIPSSFQGGCDGLTLPPFTIAEILCRGLEERRATLGVLTRHNVRIGLEPNQAFRFLSRMPHENIPNYDPFPPVGSELETGYGELLLETNATVGDEAAKWSASRREDANHFKDRLAQQSKNARQLVRELHRQDKFATADEMLREMANGPDSYVGKLILDELFPAASAAQRPVLFDLAIQNHFLRHFFHVIAHYLVSISRGWKDQKREETQLHRNVDKNDWTDLTLSLYVGSDDVVVSDDKLHKSILGDLGMTVVSASEL